MSEPLTVDRAIEVRAGAMAETRRLYDLIECCLNAEAAFHMMGCKRPKRTSGFLPVGVQTLVQIEDVLASMAFACELCGCPAETGSDDTWVCEDCIATANAAKLKEQPGE